MPSLDPLIPISAAFTPPIGPLNVTWSYPLNPGIPLDTGNWFVRRNNVSQVILGAFAAGNVVTLGTFPGAGDVGPDVVSFSPPPFDVISDTTRPQIAQAFADFPYA